MIRFWEALVLGGIFIGALFLWLLGIAWFTVFPSIGILWVIGWI